jgi:signal transduction histidine kinase
MNPAMIDRIGHDATGQLCYEALHGFDKKCKWCKYEETFQNGYTEKNIISPLDNRSFHVSSTVFVNENESLSKLFVLRDTTEFIELQKRLQQAQKMEAIGNLAGGIAHDFNNILFPIIGMSEMMMEDLSTGSREQKYANEINKAGHRAKELVSQILSFSRQSDQEKMPVRVQKVLKEVLKLCRSTIPANIKIAQKIEQDCGAIRGNTTQIHQIGMNLITNAYHAVQEKNGNITVALEEIKVDRSNFPGTINHPGNYLLFTVSDDGIGMTHRVKEKIFEPYFTTKERAKGTGLGLAVVYGIIKEYGGDIQVETKIGSGTTFRIYLPLIDES